MNYKKLLFILFGLPVISGCAEKFELAYNPPAGYGYTQRTVQTAQFTQHSYGSAEYYSIEKNALCKYSVTANNNQQVEATVKYLTLEMEVQQNDRMGIKYSSELDKLDSVTAPSRLLESITQIPISLTLGNKMQIVKKDGFDVIEWTLEDKAKNYGVDNIILNQMVTAFGEKGFCNDLTAFAFFPGKKVKLKESWQYDYHSADGNKTTYPFILSLTEVAGNTATVKLTGSFRILTDENDKDKSPNGQASGLFYVSLDTGLIIEGNMTIAISGTIRDNIPDAGWSNTVPVGIVLGFAVNTVPLN